jgi:uncharacterized RDD family membrane protein YckC
MTATAADGAAVEFERSRADQAWARWLARSADALMLTPFVFIAFAVLGVLIEIGRAPAVILSWFESPLLAGVLELGVMFLLFALWEPLFLSNTGTTPGKWLMGMRIRRTHGEKLSFARALGRFVRVWFIGMGAGVPLLSLITMLMARAKLAADGVTGWDERLDSTVHHRKRHPLVWTLVIVLVVGLGLGLRLLNRLSAEGGF